ncbi:PIN domain-containing protein [Archangium gephyra]|uniref:PIN domain-containing protein n=1 Tax=Archangium gephyra TaxID=48 RepID=A0ABX9K340_9BACT|nr:PIN domain-containing protein [Archangium gephyra]REG32309.1 PIN domain-containing protein [Archangium gephyra]
MSENSSEQKSHFTRIDPELLVLDGNILLGFPEILSASITDLVLVIPRAVQLEIAGFGGKRQPASHLKDLVATAIERKIVTTISVQSDLEGLPKEASEYRLGGADWYILETAVFLKKTSPRRIAIATRDSKLRRAAQRLGIDCLSMEQVRYLMQTRGQMDQALAADVQEVRDSQRKYILNSGTLAGLGLLVASVFVMYFDAIVAAVRVWGTVSMLLISGPVLFWFRSRWRLAYGLVEFGIGCLMGCQVFIPDFSYEKLGVLDTLRVLAGVYVMVRGMDNIGKGLDGTQYAPFWKRAFPEG